MVLSHKINNTIKKKQIFLWNILITKNRFEKAFYVHYIIVIVRLIKKTDLNKSDFLMPKFNCDLKNTNR